MAIVLACAYPNQASSDAGDLLLRLGVAEPLPNDRHGYGPDEIIQKMCVSHHIGENRRTAFQQYHPGTTWQVVGADMFLANADHPNWGWSSKNMLYFFDFWKGFDPQIGFLFLYSTPERALAQLINDGEVSADRVYLEAAGWTSYYREVLRLYSENSERCLLVDVDAATDDFDAFRTLSAERFSLGDTSPIETADAPFEGAILELIVNAFSEELVEARGLYEELGSVADMPSGAAAITPTLKAEAAWEELTVLANGEGVPTTLGLGGSASERLKTAHETIQLLQGQLKQTQEELRYYFLQASELSIAPSMQQVGGNARTRPASTAAAEIDLTSFVDGSNWYHAESDGRWAGPDRTSTIRLPKLAAGKYRLEIDVAAGMADDILNGIQVRLGSTPVRLSKTMRNDVGGMGGVLRRMKAVLRGQNAYPLRLSGNVALGNEAPVLSLDCPRTISPITLGESDTRHLSVRVKTVRLISV
ncbi:MAG: hypothetical protein AAF950_01350 [Pseudomonadota bacterium]